MVYRDRPSSIGGDLSDKLGVKINQKAPEKDQTASVTASLVGTKIRAEKLSSAYFFKKFQSLFLGVGRAQLFEVKTDSMEPKMPVQKKVAVVPLPYRRKWK